MTDAPNLIPTDRSTPWRAVRLLVIVLTLIVLALPCIPFLGIPIQVYNARRERHRLLHETDHQALLAASRKLMRDYAGQHIADPAQDVRVPLIIRELGPSYMDISAEQLRVELHGGFDHFGFIAFAEGVGPGDGRGRVIDGLFYYSE